MGDGADEALNRWLNNLEHKDLNTDKQEAENDDGPYYRRRRPQSQFEIAQLALHHKIEERYKNAKKKSSR